MYTYTWNNTGITNKNGGYFECTLAFHFWISNHAYSVYRLLICRQQEAAISTQGHILQEKLFINDVQDLLRTKS